MITIDIIKKELEATIFDYETKVAMWEGVKRVCKKGGGDFTVLSKNFDGAKINRVEYSLRSRDYEIRVDRYIPHLGSFHDYISITPQATAETDPSRVIHESYLTPYYIMTPDEITNAIQNRISVLKKNIEELKKQLEVSEAVFSKFTNAIDTAMIELKKEAGDNTSLYFKAKKYLEGVY